MPSFTLPRHWLAQTFALLCMALLYAAMAAFTCYAWKIHSGGFATLDQALIFAAALWCYPAVMAPAFLSRKDISPRAFAQQQALAALAGLAMSVVVALIPTMVVVQGFNLSGSAIYIWLGFVILVACIMVPGMKGEFAGRAAKPNAM